MRKCRVIVLDASGISLDKMSTTGYQGPVENTLVLLSEEFSTNMFDVYIVGLDSDLSLEYNFTCIPTDLVKRTKFPRIDAWIDIGGNSQVTEYIPTELTKSIAWMIGTTKTSRDLNTLDCVVPASSVISDYLNNSEELDKSKLTDVIPLIPYGINLGFIEPFKIPMVTRKRGDMLFMGSLQEGVPTLYDMMRNSSNSNSSMIENLHIIADIKDYNRTVVSLYSSNYEGSVARKTSWLFNIDKNVHIHWKHELDGTAFMKLMSSCEVMLLPFDSESDDEAALDDAAQTALHFLLPVVTQKRRVDYSGCCNTPVEHIKENAELKEWERAITRIRDNKYVHTMEVKPGIDRSVGPSAVFKAWHKLIYD